MGLVVHLGVGRHPGSVIHPQLSHDGMAGSLLYMLPHMCPACKDEFEFDKMNFKNLLKH